MARQLVIQKNEGFPPGPGLPDHSLEFFDRVWLPFMPPPTDDDTLIDYDAGRFVNIEDAAVAELAQQTANEGKDHFVKMLEAWDEQHDAEVKKPRNRITKKLYKSRDSLVAKVRADISKKHSWEEVLDELHEAGDAYTNPPGIGKVRKWFRKAADGSKYIEPFVDFIPNFEYSSVVCAGIKFILKACAAAGKFREEAFDLVDQLPGKIDLSSEYVGLYGTNPKFQWASNQLFSNILGVIESLMYCLTKDHTFEWLKPLFLQSAYDPLEGKIKELGKATAQLEAAVRLCDSKKLVEIGDGMKVLTKDNALFKNMILAFFRAHYQKAKWFEDWRSYQENAKRVGEEQKPRAYISQTDLLLLLNTNTSLEVSDPDTSMKLARSDQISTLERILHFGFSMDREEQIRAEWLMASKKVSRWFRSTRSRTILINGNHLLELITPLSFFCAMLVKSLKSLESIIVLSHFCGLSEPGDEEESGSTGLLRSLLTQLVEQWKFGELTCLSQEDAEKLKSASPNLTPRDQRRLFHKLVNALPSGKPIFIIIDGISYYEISEFKHETKKVVQEINGLLSDGKLEAMAKVLVTSATRAFEVDEYFENDQIIEMPMPGDAGGASLGSVDTQFEFQFESKIARLERSSPKPT